MELYSLLRESNSSHLFKGGSWVSVMTQKFIETKHNRACLHTLLAPILLINKNYYLVLTMELANKESRSIPAQIKMMLKTLFRK